MIAAVRAATRICATDAFAHVRDPELAPMPAPEALDDDDAAGGWIRANAWTYHHAVGTCGMGTNPAEAAVVDGRCLSASEMTHAPALSGGGRASGL